MEPNAITLWIILTSLWICTILLHRRNNRLAKLVRDTNLNVERLARLVGRVADRTVNSPNKE